MKIDGHSVLPLIKDAKTPSLHRHLHWGSGNGWAVREGPWKLIGSGDQARFLGNLEDEQPERQNHLKGHPEVVAKLLRLHREWAKETTPPSAGAEGPDG